MTSKRKLSDKPNLWKDKRIAPMDYCRLDRASRLLDCEIADILHWGSTRYIQICIKVHKLHSELRLAGSYSPIDAKKLFTDFTGDSITENNLAFGDNRLSKFYSRLRDNEISNYPRTFQCGYLGEASGFWALTPSALDVLAREDVGKIRGLLYPLQYDEFYKKNTIYPYVLIRDEVDKNSMIRPGDLYLTRKIMEKIYHSSVTGVVMNSITTDISITEVDEFNDAPKRDSVTLEGSLSVIGMMLEALKNADPKNKRWIQSALKDEIKERHPEVNPRWLDDYFSEANKSIKS